MYIQRTPFDELMAYRDALVPEVEPLEPAITQRLKDARTPGEVYDATSDLVGDLPGGPLLQAARELCSFACVVDELIDRTTPLRDAFAEAGLFAEEYSEVTERRACEIYLENLAETYKKRVWESTEDRHIAEVLTKAAVAIADGKHT